MSTIIVLAATLVVVITFVLSRSADRGLSAGSNAIVPIPRPVPATTVPPSSVHRCADLPSRCGYPDETNTGAASSGLKRVPEEVTSGPGWKWLPTAVGGVVQISRSGTVFSGYEITNGGINVDSTRRVTISNVSITWSGENFGIGLRHTSDTVISNVTITAPEATGPRRLLVGIKDVTGDQTGLQILRCNVSRASTGIQTDSGLVQDNYVHDLGRNVGDHINGTTSNTGTQVLVLRHNTVLNNHEQTDAISLFQDFGAQANKTIENNLLAGGTWVIYGGRGQFGPTHDIRIVGNRISRKFMPLGGQFGPIADVDRDGIGNVVTANIWDDDGELISID